MTGISPFQPCVLDGVMLRWARKQYGMGIGLAVAGMAWGEEEPVILLPWKVL